MTTITWTAMRRFILGQQGLWPGRRWRGKDGAAAALRACGAIQIDPLTVVARNHDLALWGRVLDYRPEHLDVLMHQERAFFDYGNLLYIYPMDELPYWRHVMRANAQHHYYSSFISERAELVERVRAELQTRGPLGHRDLEGERIESYRARKDAGLVLHHLWITGELMSHSRKGGQRLYAFAHDIAPSDYNTIADEAETQAFFARKVFRHLGMTTERGWAAWLRERVAKPDKGAFKRLLDSGDITPVMVEGVRDRHYALTSDLPYLEAVANGGVPAVWMPLDTTTDDEAVLLAPLEIVSARRRAQTLFDFEYVWEIYKPVHQRKWGYYTMPILYGDRLAARIDPKLDRKTRTLLIQGFWLEEAQPPDEAFARALGRGLAHFARFHDAARVDTTRIAPDSLRAVVDEVLGAAL